LFLVEIDGDEVEANRRALAQDEQQIEQRVAVLAAREAHHDLVAVLDHVEIGDRLAGEAQQALAQLDVLALRFFAAASIERRFDGCVHSCSEIGV